MGRALLRLSATRRTLFVSSLTSQTTRHLRPPIPDLSLSPPRTRVFLGFRPLCSTAPAAEPVQAIHPAKHSLLLDRLRNRHRKAAAAATKTAAPSQSDSGREGDGYLSNKSEKKKVVSSFEELGLSEEVMEAVREMGISAPTEIQCIGVPAVLDGTSVVLGSHTGSGKTLAYMLPIVQMLRSDEALFGMLMKPRRPRAVVLCPTRELCEQVFRVAKSISHHARFRSAMVSGGSAMRPQEDSLNTPIDMVVGTPGRVLQHIEEGNIVYGDIKYLVLDEADTMFDQGFGPDIRKFISPLNNRALKSEDQGYQKVLVTATMTKAVQKLVDEEFQDIAHLRTSSFHKKIASAHHDFIKLSGSENKLEALLQVLVPSLSKGNRVMVFCNTLNSSRAVDHFLSENNIYTVNYHGEVPAEQRVENLKKFKSQDADCPTLVCTDLAARGLDLDVDHVIMFDFPLNSIDYLHRTGRTARMGAKGKVTSLVAKKDLALAIRVEEAVKKNESLEYLSLGNVHGDITKDRISNQRSKTKASTKPLVKAYARKSTAAKPGKSSSVPAKSWKTVHVSKYNLSGGKKQTDRKFNSARSATTKLGMGTRGKKQAGGMFIAAKSPATKRGAMSGGKKQTVNIAKSITPKRNVMSVGKKQTNRKSSVVKANSPKLSVVGFRGQSSLLNKK